MLNDRWRVAFDRIRIKKEKQSVLLAKILFMALVMFLCFSFGVSEVAAWELVTWEDEGGGSGGGWADCSVNAVTYLCDAGGGAGSGGGGASWRIFKVNNGKGLDDWTGYGNSILSESKKAYEIQQCKNINADYLVSYGWDGMHGSHYGYPDYKFQIGPASRHVNGVAQVIDQASYNSYNAENWSDLKTDYKNGGWANNTKITKGAATQLYRRFLMLKYGWTWEKVKNQTIPLNLGVFCAKGIATTSSAFQGRARVSEGAWKTATNADSTGWTSSDDEAEVLMRSSDNGVTARYLIDLRSKSSTPGDVQYRLASTGSAWPKTYSKVNVTHDNKHVLTYYDTKEKKTKDGSWTRVFPGETFCNYVDFKANGSDSTILSACATATVTAFAGYVGVNFNSPDVGIESTDWGRDSVLKNQKISNCTNGCSIRFSHFIYTSNNLGSTYYRVERVSNATSDKLGDKRIIATSKLKEGYSVGPVLAADKWSKGWLYTDKLVLYPGMKVCEKLHFYNSNHHTSKVEAVRGVCIYAEGNAQPEDSSAHTFLDIKVRNNNVTKYDEYQEFVYAKPGDRVQFKSSYDPVLQYTYHLVPDAMRIDGGWQGDNNGSTFGVFFNSKRGDDLKWNNGFGVKGENLASTMADRSFVGDAGDINYHGNSDPVDYDVDGSDVGKELNEKAKTNENIQGQKINTTTPSQVSFVYDSNSTKLVGNVITKSIEKIAKVAVPYNFTTAIDVELEGARTVKVDGKEKPAFASGENGNVKIHVDLLEKHNDLTTNDANEKYATKSDDAKLKLILFVPGGSTYPEDTTDYGTLNSALCNRYSGSSVCSETFVEKSDNAGKVASRVLQSIGLNGGSTDENSGFTVPDLDAGTQVCVAAAVYPSTSGSDANLDPKGDDKWNISKAKCFAVYKKPSLQVWGGNVFSAGKIDTPAAVKKHIFNNNGYDDYNILSKGAGRIFGSFGEISVISLGSVSGFSSGAATGYAGYNERDHVMIPRQSFPANMLNVLINQKLPIESFGGYVGGSDSDFCERSRLTFANTGCNNGVTTGLGGSGQSSASANRSSLIATFVNMNDEERARKNVTVETPGGDYTISGEVLLAKGNGEEETPGETKVIYAQKGDVTIDTNILYDDSGYYKLSDVPKLVIYAKNIWINCGVTRIDAVLIAENTVDTCADLDGDSMSRKSSNQLVINGTIITDKLEARRTYGAAAGGNSIVPAEIVNYDTTLYLWGSNQADVTETGKLDVTYSREIAPKR